MVPQRPARDRREHVEVHGDQTGKPQYGEEPIEQESSMERYSEDAVAERENQIAKITSIIWLVFGVLEALIAFRVLLRLLAANPNNGFADFIYNITYPFLAPFFGLVGTPASDGNVLEVPSLIAMLVYLFMAWVIVRIVELTMTPTRVRNVSTYHKH